MKRSETDTRQRLLEAATEIFAQKGYARTRIAEVCTQADANIALVNYYFGDKKSLYNRAWRYAFEQAKSDYPLAGGARADSPAEIRLKSAIRAILSRIFSDGPAACFPRLLVHEMANPSGFLKAISEEAILPEIDYVSEIIREMLGPDADDRSVRDCAASTLNQCFMLNCGQQIAKKIFGLRMPPNHDLESITEHVFTFSKAGIAAVKEGLERS